VAWLGAGRWALPGAHGRCCWRAAVADRCGCGWRSRWLSVSAAGERRRWSLGAPGGARWALLRLALLMALGWHCCGCRWYCWWHGFALCGRGWLALLMELLMALGERGWWAAALIVGRFWWTRGCRWWCTDAARWALVGRCWAALW